MLFGIDTDQLGGGEGMLLDDSYEERMEAIKNINHPQTWDSPGVTARIAAQHSQFIYSVIKPGSPHGSLALGKPESLLAIRIPAKDKPTYLKLLSANFDITLLSLFPDIDGFGTAYAVGRDRWSNERW